jgi:hypothetical protein
MSGPRFDPTVSFGNILTAGAVLVAVAVSWATTDAKVVGNTATIASLREKGDLLETRVRVLEISLAAQSSDLSNIRALLAEIKGDIRQLVDAPNGP